LSEGERRKVPDFESLAQPGIRGLRAYDPGLDIVALRQAWPRGRLVELGSNENALGPSPAARDAAAASLADMHRYPDPLGSALKAAIADRNGVAPSQVVLGNGSHELLMMLAQVFAGPDRAVLVSQYGFAVYALAAQAAGARLDVVPAFGAAAAMPLGHDVDAMAAACREDTGLVYLANPNNPTGTWFGLHALERLLDEVGPDCLVVVDEAYIEYATDPDLASAARLLAGYPNLVVARTFSKAHGLAGLRVGYVLAHPGLAAVLERVRENFNVSVPGLAAATAALADDGHVARVREENERERGWLAAGLRSLGVRVGPSQTNFLLLEFGRPAAPIEAALLREGVVPRPMSGYGLPGHSRLTVSTRAENLVLLSALERALA
jgi:histidinol-phosphate aminotransferase